MTKDIDSGTTESRPARKRRRPITLIVAAVSLLLLFVLANMFQLSLSDSIFAFDFAIVNIVTTIAIGLLFIGTAAWLWFFSNWSAPLSFWLPIVMLAGGAAGLILYQPVFDGGMGINRWQARFWNSRVFSETSASEILGERLKTADPLAFGQFMGPRRTGVVDEFNGPLDDAAAVKRLYSVDVGDGRSGIVATHGHAFTMEQRGEFECVVCYEIESGKSVWTYQHKRRHDDVLGGAGPRSTPTIDGDRIYAQGANGLLVCLDGHTGQLVWSVDISKSLGIALNASVDGKGRSYQVEANDVMWGRSGSPLVVGDYVVVPGDGPDDQAQVSLIAFNKFNGKEIWRGGDDGIGYGSPVLYNLAGKLQIVIENAASVSGHDPATGKVLWSHDRPGNSDADANTSQAIKVSDNRLLLSKGYGMGGEILQIDVQSESSAGKLFTATSVWKNQGVLKTKLTSTVVYQEHAYALSDGILECVDIESGQRVWKRGRYGHGQILLVSGMLLVHSERGTLHVIQPSPQGLNELYEIETVKGICWNNFCVYDRFLLVRSDIEMACFEFGL